MCSFWVWDNRQGTQALTTQFHLYHTCFENSCATHNICIVIMLHNALIRDVNEISWTSLALLYHLLVHGDGADDHLPRLLPVHVVQAQGVDTGRQVTSHLHKNVKILHLNPKLRILKVLHPPDMI